MRPGVPSEVPPNFWTRIGRVTDSGRAANIALPREPFRQEDSALARTELGVVREHDVLHAVERRLVTRSTFSSPPGMKGMTLSITSGASPPPCRPAPETAWSEVIVTVRTPKASWSGLSETASPVVVQLGIGAMKPRQPRVRR